MDLASLAAMFGIRAHLCRAATAAALMLLPLWGCGRSVAPTGEVGGAGQGGNGPEVAGAGSGGKQVGSGGKNAGGGGMGSGGTGGGGTGGGGSYADGGRAPLTSDCQPWPADCQVQCDIPIAGCLLAETELLPSESVELSVEVTAVQTRTGAENGLGCRGPTGFFGNSFTTGTELSLLDATGTPYTLLFPAEVLAPERFPIGTALEVSYSYDGFGFSYNHLLVVREQGDVVLFVFDAATKPFAIPGLDLELEIGTPSCPWSPAQTSVCSSAHFHTVASSGAVVADDPCGTAVGDFTVSSISHASATRCGARYGFCDGTSRFLASGVRRN